MRGTIVFILSFVYLAAGLPEFYWSSGGNPGAGYSCVRINEDAVQYWDDNYLCSATRDLSAWVWSSAGIPAGSGMKCVQWLEIADYSWQDNYLCIPETDNEFSYKFFSAGNPNDGSSCVQITEGADPDSWNDNFFCAYTASATNAVANFIVPFAPHTAASYRITNPIWWVSSADYLTYCSISTGAPDMTCTLAGSPKPRDIIIHSNGAGAAPSNGELHLVLSNGQLYTYNIGERAGTLACIHGTVHVDASGTASCACIPGWFGDDCSTLFKVTATPNQAFVPASYLDSTSPITQCHTSGFAHGNPSCEIRGTDPWYTGDLTSTQIRLHGGVSGSTGMLAFEVAGQYWIYASLTLADGLYQKACVNGFLLNGACTCKTGFGGPYCDIPTCDANCVNGKCAQTDVEATQCSCYQHFSTDPSTPLSQCTIFDCASSPCDLHGTCVGSGSSATCQCDNGWGSSAGGYCNLKLCNTNGLPSGGIFDCNVNSQVECVFTKSPYPGTYPGWCKTAAISQECSPGPGDIPVSFPGCIVPSTDSYQHVNGLTIAQHNAAFFL